MARARSIKPGFFKNELLAQLPCQARLLFIGLWTLADRAGRLEDRPLRIRIEIFPYDSIDLDPMLDSLAGSGFIERYVVSGMRLISIINFGKHQYPNVKESASTLPAPYTPGADTVPARPVTPYLLPVTPYPIPDPPSSDQPAPVLVLARSVGKSDFEPELRFQEFREKHPGTKTRIGDCRAQYMRLVLDSIDPVARADSLDANQVKWLDYWANSSTPPLGLLNFLAGGDCMEPPPEIDTCPEWARGMK